MKRWISRENLKNLPHYWIPYAFKKGEARPPLSLSFEITYRCNLRCMMCPQALDYNREDSRLRAQRRINEELRIEEIFSLIDAADDLEISTFQITGGEPLIRPDLPDIVRYVKSKNMKCTLISNGTLLKERTARELVSSGIDEILLSLDGPEPIHNRVRGHEWAFGALMDGLRAIDRAKNERSTNVPSISFIFVIMAHNYSQMSRTIDCVNQMGVRVAGILFGYLFYSSQEMEDKTSRIISSDGVKAEDQDVPRELRSIDGERLEAEVKKARRKGKESGVRVEFRPYFKGKEIQRRFTDDSFALAKKCFYPWYELRLNPYGDVYPCSMNIRMGNIREDRLEDVWNSRRYVDFRRILMTRGLFPRCTKCCVLHQKMWSYLPCLVHPQKAVAD